MKIEEISNFAYDGLDRLVSEVESSGIARSYAYDLAGNRLAKTETGSGAITYALGVGDRLANYTGGSYAYDTAGCVTAIDRTGKPDLDLTWNGQYQLTSVSTNGVVAESYTYDPFGRRASTTSGGTTTRHIYDGIHCVADIDSVGRVVKSYTWGPGVDNLLAITCHSGALATTYYALTDLQGTVHGFADAGGNLVARYAYDAWGNLLDADVAVSALADNRFLFQGREYSWATGLTNFRLRWYDPATGRWLSKDPIGTRGGLNMYEFCENDPVNFVDIFGLSPKDVKNILDSFKSEVAAMTDEGKRNNFYIYNNLAIPAQQLGAWSVTGKAEGLYNGCKGQAYLLQASLNEIMGSLDDKWQFNVTPTWAGTHYILTAKSSQKNDPTILLDPWRNKTKVKPNSKNKNEE